MAIQYASINDVCDLCETAFESAQWVVSEPASFGERRLYHIECARREARMLETDADAADEQNEMHKHD